MPIGRPVDPLRALVPRMRPYATTIFGEMSALANRLGAVNLGQGFPDTDGPDELKRIAIRAIEDGSGNQYPPAHGHPDLRAAIAEHQDRWYGLRYDPATEVVVGTGASEVIGAALLALVGPGDEVLLLEPAFDIYAAGVALAGATAVPVPLGPGFRPDPLAIASAVTARTRLILVNSPHNPTGTVLTTADLDGVAAVARAHDLVVLSDEVYEHLVYDEALHVPMATRPGMRERTLTVGSGGKSFSFTGWKVGWATGPEHLVAAVRVVRQHLSYVSGGPFQPAVAAGLRLPDDYFRGFSADLAARRDRLAQGLASVGLPPLRSEGTYFAVTDVRPLGWPDGETFARALPERAGVVAIPVSAFCSLRGEADAFVRWTFCKRPEVLDEAVARLRERLA